MLWNKRKNIRVNLLALNNLALIPHFRIRMEQGQNKMEYDKPLLFSLIPAYSIYIPHYGIRVTLLLLLFYVPYSMKPCPYKDFLWNKRRND